jgi:hypothetical protein
LLRLEVTNFVKPFHQLKTLQSPANGIPLPTVGDLENRHAATVQGLLQSGSRSRPGKIGHFHASILQLKPKYLPHRAAPDY